jgi:hypothetical protein
VGFQPLFASYFTSFAVPVVISARIRGKSSPDISPLSPLANNVLYNVALIEGRAIALGARIPIGTTLIRVARRP